MHGERIERPWGWFQTISETPGCKVKRIGVAPGHQLSLQRHLHRAEHWVVVSGNALATVGERMLELAAGQHVDIAVNEVHRLANPGSTALEVLELQFGERLDENDIVRLHDDYGRS